MAVTLSPADLNDPDFVALVDAHTAFCDRTAPPESCHRLAVDALAAPDVTVWSAHIDGALIGMGAVKRLNDQDGEVKSMHTCAAARGQGVARHMLQQIISHARDMGLSALWLETGTHPEFKAACALYEAFGFVETGPFGSYVLDPHSTFYTLRLDEPKGDT
ncbi:MAG: GNAT family N-acetyltransferase [Pelagimonas sp.]|jgi:putative acetyltransferase|nr:GNAT family N-acetyltransferase [Pelagimonas sp.]